MQEGWISTYERLPEENEVVLTKIEDEGGVRNQQKLCRYKNLWFLEDGSMYVYYRPTHWKPVS